MLDPVNEVPAIWKPYLQEWHTKQKKREALVEERDGAGGGPLGEALVELHVGRALHRYTHAWGERMSRSSGGRSGAGRGQGTL